MSPNLFNSWLEWNKQESIAINRGKPELVTEFKPPPDSDWKLIDQKTHQLKFELSKVPK